MSSSTGIEAEMARFEEEVLGNDGPEGNVPDLPPPPFMQSMEPPPMLPRFNRNDNYNDEPYYNNGPDRRFDDRTNNGPGPMQGRGRMMPGPGPMPGHHSDMLGPGPLPPGPVMYDPDPMPGPGPIHGPGPMPGPRPMSGTGPMHGPGPMRGPRPMPGPRPMHGPGPMRGPMPILPPGPLPIPISQMIGPGIPSGMRPIGPEISSPAVITAQPRVYAAPPIIMKPPQVAKKKRKLESNEKHEKEESKEHNPEVKVSTSTEPTKDNVPAPTPSLPVVTSHNPGPSNFAPPRMPHFNPGPVPMQPMPFHQATAASGYDPAAAKVSKKKKFIRTAAGQSWEDPTLQEWDPNDYRLFCGDLGNEVTDDVLMRVFNKYSSFQKAKVVRERNSKKSKGYGFVSFKDPNDFIRAMREMNGKYVGNRPIKLRKSNWKDRNIEVVRKKLKEKKKLGYKV